MQNKELLAQSVAIGERFFPELSEKQATSLVLVAFFGRRSAASIMQLSDNTLKTHLDRTRKMMNLSSNELGHVLLGRIFRSL